MNNQILIVIVCLVFMTPSSSSSSSSITTTTQVLAPNCTTRCGNMEIWYPFGIEEGCYFKDDGSKAFEFFKVNCSRSSNNNQPKPLWDNSGIELLSIAVISSELRLKHRIAYQCYNKQNQVISSKNASTIRAAQFTFSSTKNMFVVIGCDSFAVFNGSEFRPRTRPYTTGCITVCPSLNDTDDGECNGVGCCQLPLPGNITSLTTTVDSVSGDHSGVQSFNPCNMAFMVEKAVFKFTRRNLTNMGPSNNNNNTKRWAPVVVDWSIDKQSCSSAEAQGKLLCNKTNTHCQDLDYQTGYICTCHPGFSGNPYHPQGCIFDINECESGSHNCEKSEYCVNDIGKHHCQCPNGYRGKGTMNDHCVSLAPVIITAGGGSVIILLLSIAFIMYMKREKGKLTKLQEKFFQQNGGVLLHQKLVGSDVPLKNFTEQNIVDATDNYNEKYIIGRGGFGIVYKGTLPDNQYIAIKRSLKMDPSKVEEFVNEVLILSQINNKNVVKLLGCCLETEVPLLVYEFITNGTLYDHLNDAVKASMLTWSTRLNIASEVADVLSYLHNTISTRIIHRDMKSMNILLDENYTSKVADFGASRVVPTDEDQVATMIVGTWGYLDPEYLQTSELTEKSDVYSFGVVLVELLTRRKAVANDRPEPERNLAMHFCTKMKEGKLLDILDKSIVGEGTIKQIQLVANLAKQCLIRDRDNRPAMKEVAMELEIINRNGLHMWNKEDESFQDHVSLLGEFRGSETGGNSSGVHSDLYVHQPISSLGSGR